MKASKKRPRFRAGTMKKDALGQNGMALVIVLALIVLLTILVVGFLQRAGTERHSASNYRASISSRQLADSAVNLVQAQIAHATTQGGSRAWASQPGAIRLFKADGQLERIYRLYSASAMTADTSVDLADDVPPTTWSASPALWVDLNAPVTVLNASGDTQTSFPILDPRDPLDLSKVVSNIEGFSLTAPPGATSIQPAPMPVRWLYVLQNGEMVAPAAINGGRVTVSAATNENPIIGRVAFWTDDETCKVNINTASGGNNADSDGTMWTAPVYCAQDEADRAMNQPVTGEYQRYPGHPATTTLMKVLKGLDAPGLFKLSPRYDEGGSKGGTVNVYNAQAFVPGKERLFPSVGEMTFDKTRDENLSLSSQQRETARFFLTANSRAPEVTSFGTPRVAMWPLNNNSDHRTAIDQLIAFCSTVNKKPYYFTRENPDSQTEDISLSRNSELLNYLDHFTSEPIPGQGGDYKKKYGELEKRQILTEIFDFVRCVNIMDSTSAHPYADPDPNVQYEAGEGQVVPSTSSWGTQGFGRFHRLSEAALILVPLGQGQVGSTPPLPVPSTAYPPYASSAGGGATPPDNTRAIQALFFMTFFSPSPGWPGLISNFTVQVDGLNSFGIAGQQLGMPSSATLTFNQPNWTRQGATNYWVPLQPDLDAYAGTVTNKTLGTGPTNYPFFSNILEIPVPTSGTMAFTGGTVTITIYAGTVVAPENLIQTYTLKFPPWPNLIVPNNYYPDGTKIYRNEANFKILDIMARQSILNQGWALDAYTIFSMIPDAPYSDYRLLARTGDVPNDFFVKHPYAGTQQWGYGFNSTAHAIYPNAWAGTLVNDPLVIDYERNKYRAPLLPFTLAGAYAGNDPSVPGDWSSGTINMKDGAFIGKPDEGNVKGDKPGQLPYFQSTFARDYFAPGATFFSPNRMISSPVLFGSLPTGVISKRPWQTLLFRPGPTGHWGGKDLPSAGDPADHHLLDLFWMPVAEPYAISEPFSTAGKVNLNYQIVPFNYINRSTALRSVLSSERVAAVPGNLYNQYKELPQNISKFPNSRWPLNMSDVDGTLRQFKEKFAAGDIFHSASEICEVFLVPSNKSWNSDAAARSDWYGNPASPLANDFTFVGDDVREQPYANIYPRVTTKCNVYAVYTTVQTLKNLSGSPTEWDETKGKILGEYRGSTVIERYLDPNNAQIPDYATQLTAPSLDNFYRWRVIKNSQFAP